MNSIVLTLRLARAADAGHTGRLPFQESTPAAAMTGANGLLASYVNQASRGVA